MEFDGNREGAWRVPTTGNVPLWKQCATHIAELIRNGTLAAGQAMPVHSELALQTGVGASTLQKSLAYLTRQGLLVRHRNRGTFVASKPDHRGEKWVAVMTRAAFDPALSQWDLLAARAVVHTLADAGARFRFYHNSYLSGHPDAQRQDIDPRMDEDIEAGRVQGLLVVGSVPPSHPEFREQLKKARIPLVETSSQGNLTPYVVEFDRSAFVRHAVELAAARGCRRLAFLETPGFEVNGHDPLAEAFAAEIRRLGLDVVAPCPYRIAWPPSAAKGVQAFEDLWQDRQMRPDGLIITDEHVALGAAQAAAGAGVAVPEELWLVTSTTAGHEIAWPVPVETVAFDPAELMDRAWAMLQAGMNGEVVTRRQLRIGPRWVEATKTEPAGAGYRAEQEIEV